MTKTTIRLWDLPVRLFHWGTVILIPLMWLTYKQGNMERHQALGLMLLFLWITRLIWGFIGSETARFTHFVKGPIAILGYLRGGDGKPHVGHNPLGALSVVALLVAVGAQIGLGLFAQDTDALFSGPLNHYIPYESMDLGDKVREWHEAGFYVILALVALHLVAIAFYALVKKDRLAPAMITGRKSYKGEVAQPAIAPLWRIIPALVIAGVVTSWIARGAPLPF